jgi:hypothetical protein
LEKVWREPDFYLIKNIGGVGRREKKTIESWKSLGVKSLT